MTVYEKHLFQNKILIAGPCALESRAQLKNTVRHLSAMGIKMVRASLWKPRTTPSWEGLGFWGLFHLLEETLPYGIIPATEIITAQQAQMIIEALKVFDKDAPIILWIGSRNQNHFEVKAIAKILAEGSNAILMFKNQMWEDQKHWLGIFEHIFSAGYPKDRLIACHRGFAPGRDPNAEHLRNIPNYEMAMMVKNHTTVPMILDPSHIAGSRDKVFAIMKASQLYEFDGLMVEVHDNVNEARTDSTQQLSIDEFYEFLQLMEKKEEAMELMEKKEEAMELMEKKEEAMELKEENFIEKVG